MGQKNSNEKNLEHAYVSGFVNQATTVGRDEQRTESLYGRAQEIAETRNAIEETLKEQANNR